MAEQFRVADYQGRPVLLADDGMAHIRQRHPDMMNRLDAIADAIHAPAAVTRSRLLDRGENHYGRYGDRLYVRVSVIYRPTPDGWVGEVMTAHLIDRIEAKEEHLWP